MRGLILAVSIPTLMMVGAASAADTSAPVRQCPAPWAQALSDTVCVQGDASRTPTLQRASYDGRKAHVLTRAEARAELDSIKLRDTAPVLLASEDR